MEDRDALHETLRHLATPDVTSPVALLRLLSRVDDWLDDAERQDGWQVIQRGRLADILDAHGEPALATWLRQGRLDPARLTPRQQRALHAAETLVAAEAEIASNLDSDEISAATDAWRRALDIGLALDPELTRRLHLARHQQRLAAWDTGVQEESPSASPIPPSRRWRDHLDARRQQRAAERAAALDAWRTDTGGDADDDAATEQAWLAATGGEARSRDLQALHAAIATDDPAAIARAYVLMRARWPESLTDDLHTGGSHALRTWGNAMRTRHKETRQNHDVNA
ncbi:MAG: hypothetical protein QM692_12980 [Thermomicrobiales bacterium]